MVRKAKSYLQHINDRVIDDENELQVLSEKCEPPLQSLTHSSSMGNIQVKNQPYRKQIIVTLQIRLSPSNFNIFAFIFFNSRNSHPSY